MPVVFCRLIDVMQAQTPLSERTYCLTNNELVPLSSSLRLFLCFCRWIFRFDPPFSRLIHLGCPAYAASCQGSRKLRFALRFSLSRSLARSISLPSASCSPMFFSIWRERFHRLSQIVAKLPELCAALVAPASWRFPAGFVSHVLLLRLLIVSSCI